ncbi:MAG: zinc ribbon domain-containing protein, partial [Actinobacteria bacterium]|nr:zinc ribbon domain-containing protein [Actinomycetota bacterium]
MNCRSCGAPLTPGSGFCEQCGTAVPATAETVRRVPTAEHE